MRRATIVSLLLAAALAGPAPAAQIMVVGRDGTLVQPRAASLKKAVVKVGGRRCRLAARTPLAALVRTPVRLSLRDYGACGRPADAGGLYVRGIDGQTERGRAGWVYKVDQRGASAGAGDPSARFARRAQVLWFWCVDASGCQRTLSVRPERATASPGATLRVAVRAHDDQGAAIPAAGATVRMGSSHAVAGPDGIAELTVPSRTGRVAVVATQATRVRSFPARVAVR